MDRYTTGAYAEDNPDWHDGDAPAKVRDAVALARDLGWRPARVVDVGCGTGAVLAGLVAGLGAASGHGVDVAPEAIRRAEDRGTPRLTFAIGGVDRAGTGDLVVAFDVAEHVADDVGFLADLRRIAPRALLRLPLELSVLDVARPGRLLSARRRYGHRHAYTRELARARVEEAGWRVVAERYVRVPVRPTGPGRALDPLRRVGVRIAPHAVVRWLGGWSWLVAAEVA